MPRVRTETADSAVLGELLVLEDERSRSRVVIAPQRGAIVSSFRVGERELLFMDDATLRDASKNVRGGIPVLFPSPGKLEADRWQHAGHSGVMKQHGFARTQTWRTVQAESHAATQTRARTVLALSANAETRAQYPWDFGAELTFTLEGARLRIDFELQNRDTNPLPFALGFHPYFHVGDQPGDKTGAQITTAATRAFDNLQKGVVPFRGFDWSAPEVDLHLLDHGASQSTLAFARGGRVTVRASPEFGLWVVWALADRPFICLEPWTAPGNALNTGERLISVAPSAVHRAFIELEYEA